MPPHTCIEPSEWAHYRMLSRAIFEPLLGNEDHIFIPSALSKYGAHRHLGAHLHRTSGNQALCAEDMLLALHDSLTPSHARGKLDVGVHDAPRTTADRGFAFPDSAPVQWEIEMERRCVWVNPRQPPANHVERGDGWSVFALGAAELQPPRSCIIAEEQLSRKDMSGRSRALTDLTCASPG